MTVTLNLPPHVQARVQAEAAKYRVPVEEYLLNLVSRSIPGTEDVQRARSLALLASVDDLGDEDEQRETFEYLKAKIDGDRLSERNRF
ncbi:MAG: hypothetical protein ABJA67_16225 [Chthonomonadales bacterium]